jgi:hypothetical protein
VNSAVVPHDHSTIRLPGPDTTTEG